MPSTANSYQSCGGRDAVGTTHNSLLEGSCQIQFELWCICFPGCLRFDYRTLHGLVVLEHSSTELRVLRALVGFARESLYQIVMHASSIFVLVG